MAVNCVRNCTYVSVSILFGSVLMLMLFSSFIGYLMYISVIRTPPVATGVRSPIDPSFVTAATVTVKTPPTASILCFIHCVTTRGHCTLFSYCMFAWETCSYVAVVYDALFVLSGYISHAVFLTREQKFAKKNKTVVIIWCEHFPGQQWFLVHGVKGSLDVRNMCRLWMHVICVQHNTIGTC